MTGSDFPGPVYIDSSALAKLYLPEPESDSVEKSLRGRRDLVISDLSVTEIVSAYARKRREGLLTREHVTRLLRAVLEDVESGAFTRLDLLPDTHRAADLLLVSVDTIPLRASDALHIALALSARCATIVTFDTRMSEAARASGMTVYP